MISKSLPIESTTPISIELDEASDQLTIVMPLAPMDCQSESGKMDVLATTNGWLKTTLICPRTAEQIQVNLFIGTRRTR